MARIGDPGEEARWFANCVGGFQQCISIRYIAVLGFQQVRWKVMDLLEKHVSIRYIAVLGFQHLVDHG